MNMDPVTISEQLMYSTVKIQTKTKAGTAFFYNFVIEEKVFPTLITNRHVVSDNVNEPVSFSIHSKNDDGSIGFIDLNYTTAWHLHPTKDLCFCFAEPLFRAIETRTGKRPFYVAVTDNLLPNEEIYSNLSAVEEVVMVGYPMGLEDRINALPLFRRGYTASHPSLDFNESGIAVIDIACFPGSSGSPIFILNENGYSDKRGTTYLGAKRVIFLGIQFAGPQYNVKGKLEVLPIQTDAVILPQTPIMVNLAYYIKASALEEFRQLIAKLS